MEGGQFSTAAEFLLQSEAFVVEVRGHRREGSVSSRISQQSANEPDTAARALAADAAFDALVSPQGQTAA